jgi:hypothetical protein
MMLHELAHESLTLLAVAIPNPAPASDPTISDKASDVIALIKLLGILGGSIALLAGGSLLWAGNRGGNHGLSVTGKGLMISGFATLIAIPTIIPVINRFFV